MGIFNFYVQAEMMKPPAVTVTALDPAIVVVDTDAVMQGTAVRALTVDLYLNTNGAGYAVWLSTTVVGGVWSIDGAQFPTIGSALVKALAHGRGGDSWSNEIAVTVVGA